MSILEDIQRAAVDSTVDLSTILRKCKLLSARLASRQLEDWVVLESNGYPAGVPVPDYRIWPLAVKGHFTGGFGSGLRNAPIPTSSLPAEVRDSYERFQYRGSVAAAESALSAAKGPLHISTADLAVVLGMNVYGCQNCLQAWAEFSPTHLVELLNAVRNRVLDFAVAVWKESPSAGEPNGAGGATVNAERLTQIFNTTVYGGSANLVGSAVSSSISFTVTANDFESLERVLMAHGISGGDVVELRAAVESEPSPADKRFGPKVSSWIGKMMGKAASGGWEIGVSAAGTVLGTAIARYYGF